MPNKYMTYEIYSRYLDFIKDGKSKAEACRMVNVPSSTMASYIKRMKLFEYSIAKRSGDHIVIVDGNIYKISVDSNFYADNNKFIFDLFNRDTYQLTNDELSLLKSVKMNKAVAENIEKASKAIKVKSDGHNLTYKGVEIPSSLLKLVNAQIKKDVKIKNIVKFADLLIHHPDPDVIDQLYDFLNFNDIEICPNGYVLAYKAVNGNYRDYYSGNFDNRVGKYCEMDRDKVVKDPYRTCAEGLHVASKEYATSYYDVSSYRNRRIVQCIIHPCDFVSIPKDYSGAKARVCKYKVVADVSDNLL